ncbi:MAG: integration host factor subunit beta [Deltaproteobacteria bacterium]|nr:integration host factor subunit beta [Deltaproteobacteria bacterium]
MNKSELIAALSTADGVSEKKAAQVLELILDEMTEALKRGERIEIRGFGSLIVKQYPTYQGRNPRSRETITVEGKRLPHFKVGKELRARINRPIRSESDAEAVTNRATSSSAIPDPQPGSGDPPETD